MNSPMQEAVEALERIANASNDGRRTASLPFINRIAHEALTRLRSQPNAENQIGAAEESIKDRMDSAETSGKANAFVTVADLKVVLDALRPQGGTVEKRAPVQGLSGGIPWSMHLRAYDAYCEKYREQAALIDLEGRNCRGGFSTVELDMFIPGWRDELSEITALKARIAELESAPPAPVGGEVAALVEEAARCDGRSDSTTTYLRDLIHRLANALSSIGGQDQELSSLPPGEGK